MLVVSGRGRGSLRFFIRFFFGVAFLAFFFRWFYFRRSVSVFVLSAFGVVLAVCRSGCVRWALRGCGRVVGGRRGFFWV